MPLRSKPLLWLVAACVVLIALGCKGEVSLPRIARMPGFEMQDQDGKPLRGSDLEGKVVIVGFMFTSCPDVCPILTTKLASVRTELLPSRANVRFLSISVDPVTDTPAVLKRYAAERGADQPDWRFVTGPLDQVRAVVVDGFKQSLDVQPETEGVAANVLHGSHFVLVDRKAFIRGYYRSDESGLLQLTRDARRLLAEPPGGEGAS